MMSLAFERTLKWKLWSYDDETMLKYFIEKLEIPVRICYLKIAARCGRFDLVMYLAEKALNHVCITTNSINVYFKLT